MSKLSLVTVTFNKDNTVISYPRPVLRVVWLPNRNLVTGLVYFDPERVALIRMNPINNKFTLSIKHSILTFLHRFYPVLIQIRVRSGSTWVKFDRFWVRFGSNGFYLKNSISKLADNTTRMWFSGNPT